MFSELSLIILATLFGVSFASNAVPFFGVSYTLIATADLIASGFNLANFGAIVLVTALGATLAKIILYTGALGLQGKLTRNKNIRLFQNWLHNRSFYPALFITAFVPILPLDDYIYIGAGANKARLAPMLGVTMLAKLAKSAFEIYLEFKGLIGLSYFTRMSGLELSISLSIMFVVLGVVLYKLDWQNLLGQIGILKTK
ncbi:MAG: hypothetical protein JRN20_02500 [Nitrososphaerota archaeon]|nr:hypothetical protein [Nitrososphaerota archaeon]MDG6923452.1 hypothetical protein [Nitrososphaerota archaeon]